MPSAMPAADKTDTHIRCRVCRQWKWRSAYRKHHGTCRECQRAKWRQGYYKLSTDVLDERARRNLDRINRVNQKACADRTINCRWMVRELRRAGLTLTAISKATGVSRATLSGIYHGKQKYLARATEKKLRTYLECRNARLG